MTTLVQMETNRANALKSTGPKTEGGKRRVSQNAVKHGILSARLLLDDESADEFYALFDDLQASLKPHGTLELVLVEKIAVCIWKQRRLVRAESAGIELERRMDRRSNRSKLEIALGMAGCGEITDSDVKPVDKDDKTVARWCAKAIAEYEGLDKAMLDIENDITRLSREAPMMFAELRNDAEKGDQIMVEYIAGYEGGLRSYADELVTWCKGEIRKLERRPVIQAVAELVKSSQSAPIPEELLSRYQTALDNELYKAMRALREAQEWRAKTIEGEATTPHEGATEVA
jgi:hypothetical protein